MMRKFKIKREEHVIEHSTIWKAERDGVIFILSAEQPEIGDYFTFIAPDDPYKVVSGKEMFKYNNIRHAKVLWCYNKDLKDLTDVIHLLKSTSEMQFL